MMTRGIRAFLLCAGLLAAWAAPAHAQAIGSIFGKVTDPSGGVLPGVTVTVTGSALQSPLVAVTSENGTYQFPSVPIGISSVLPIVIPVRNPFISPTSRVCRMTLLGLRCRRKRIWPSMPVKV